MTEAARREVIAPMDVAGELAKVLVPALSASGGAVAGAMAQRAGSDAYRALKELGDRIRSRHEGDALDAETIAVAIREMIDAGEVTVDELSGLLESVAPSDASNTIEVGRIDSTGTVVIGEISIGRDFNSRG